MAISGKLYKLAWGGSMFTTEQWVNSIHVNAPDVLPQDPEDYLAAVMGIMNSNQLKMNTGALLEYIKFNEINPATGLYADQTASHTFFLPVPAQGMGSPARPRSDRSVRRPDHGGDARLRTRWEVLPAGLSAAVRVGRAPVPGDG